MASQEFQTRAVRPVYRFAHRYQVVPPSARDCTESLDNLLIFAEKSCDEEVLNEWREAIRIAPFESDDLSILPHDKQLFREHYSDRAVFELPRLRHESPEGIPFESRICIATRAQSGAVDIWSRVGLPLARYGAKPTDIKLTSLSHLKEVCERGLHWAGSWIESLSKRESVTPQKYNEIQVCTLGTNDTNIKEILTNVQNRTLHHNQTDTYQSKLALYWSSAFHDTPESELPDLKWFTSTSHTMVRGSWTGIDLLYLVKNTNGKSQALGVGVDTSTDGDLAQKSSLKVAMWFGSSQFSSQENTHEHDA